jgi:hypothetical protein
MKRKAILIESSNVSGESDLPGARIDIENWLRFLSSRIGGAWDSDEIVILRKPSLSQLDSALKQASDRYCFVAFSGHGADGVVALNDFNKHVPVSLLRPHGTKGVRLIDSCRGKQDATQLDFGVQKKADALNEAVANSVTLSAKEGRATNFSEKGSHTNEMVELLYGRIRFKAELDKSESGIVSMLSCASGEAAGESRTAGGYYTSALLGAAVSFHTVIEGDGFLSTKEAHDYALRIMPKQQNPEYSPSNRWFPFAIKVSSPTFAF